MRTSLSVHSQRNIKRQSVRRPCEAHAILFYFVQNEKNAKPNENLQDTEIPFKKK
jgi:hypothetical protein